MGAQNSPGKIEYTNPATGEVEMIDPVEWMKRTGITQPAAMVPRQEIQYMGRTYRLRPELCGMCLQTHRCRCHTEEETSKCPP